MSSLWNEDLGWYERDGEVDILHCYDSEDAKMFKAQAEARRSSLGLQGRYSIFVNYKGRKCHDSCRTY